MDYLVSSDSFKIMETRNDVREIFFVENEWPVAAGGNRVPSSNIRQLGHFSKKK